MRTTSDDLDVADGEAGVRWWWRPPPCWGVVDDGQERDGRDDEGDDEGTGGQVAERVLEPRQGVVHLVLKSQEVFFFSLFLVEGLIDLCVPPHPPFSLSSLG